jgi:ribosomal protein L44E
MPNRQLTSDELEKIAAPLIDEVRLRLVALSGGDTDLHWALRRKLAKTLSYDERSTPMERRNLKAKKRQEQNGKCAVCSNDLPETYNVLDRYEAMKGYTAENTRLICSSCDTKIQKERGYK